MNLDDQIDSIDRALLTDIDPQGLDPLTEVQKTQIHAYLVLAHAVLEEHLESCFVAHFDRVVKTLQNAEVPREAINLVFAIGESLTAQNRQPPPYEKRHVAAAIQSLGRITLDKTIRGNHGVRMNNVTTLAKAVGVEWTAFEDALSDELSDLHNLGAKRGAAGHLSPFTEKATEISASDGPDQVRKWVRDGLSAVLKIDRFLSSLMPSAGTDFALASDVEPEAAPVGDETAHLRIDLDVK